MIENIGLRKIAILGAIGGSVFDYYIDRGIKKLNIYSEKKYIVTLASLYEQAFWLGVEIEGCYSNEEMDIAINMLEKGVNKLHILNIHRADMQAITGPFITIGILKKTLDTEQRSFTSCSKYSFRKRVLFDKVLEYRERYCPDLKICVFEYPSASQINNPDEWEVKLGTHTQTMDEKIQALLRQGFSHEVVLKLGKNYSIFSRAGIWFVKDVCLPHTNAAGGYRITVNQPCNADRTIYTFGFSTCFGFGCYDDHTIQSVLQGELNTHFHNNCRYKVLNCANGGEPNDKKQMDSFLFHKPKSGDIVIFVHLESEVLYNNYKDKMLFIRPHADDSLFDRPHNYGDVYTNTENHFTNNGYKILGEYLAKKMIEAGVFEDTKNSVKEETKRVVTQQKSELPRKEVAQYIQTIKPACPRIGAIVMNCNPFTLGHRYLIEEAARKVTSLIIFVVEEDKSIFPFKDRIELVRKGTSDLANVTVVPSGGFIISQTTFGAYFEKDSKQEETIDPTNDVIIFGSQIAPALGITIRFAGEEPLDYITKQYNDTMERILPQYGITFVVIPRKESGGEVISASKVRALLKDRNFSEIEKIVPPTTLSYLRKRYKGTIDIFDIELMHDGENRCFH